MTYTTIKYHRKKNTGIISLNRPERMNAVIEEMYQEIQQVLLAAQREETIRALILTGSALEKNGEIKQAFCAGADLKKHSTGERTLEQKQDYIRLAHKTCQMIYEFPKPVIAAVNGPARGAGTEMALNCDFILMAKEASLAFPETGLGTCVGGGVTKHLSSFLGITKAKELIYTGRIIDGETAVNKGLALASYPIDKLFDKAIDFAKELSQKAPVSMKLVKKLIHQAESMTIDRVLDKETEAIIECMKTQDWQEGIKAFSEKRKPLYKGN